PRVHDVGIADEATGLAALILVVPIRDVVRRVDGQLVLTSEESSFVVDVAVLVDRVPDRERHAEEPLPADEPVGVETLHPALEARPHVRRVPVQLASPGEQGVAQLRVVGTVSDVPLPRSYDLERARPALVELHRVRDDDRLAIEAPGFAQELDDPFTRLLDGL